MHGLWEWRGSQQRARRLQAWSGQHPVRRGAEGGDEDPPAAPGISAAGEGRKRVSILPRLLPPSLLYSNSTPYPSSHGHKLNNHPYKDVSHLQCQVYAGTWPTFSHSTLEVSTIITPILQVWKLEDQSVQLCWPRKNSQ